MTLPHTCLRHVRLISITCVISWNQCNQNWGLFVLLRTISRQMLAYHLTFPNCILFNTSLAEKIYVEVCCMIFIIYNTTSRQSTSPTRWDKDGDWQQKPNSETDVSHTLLVVTNAEQVTCNQGCQDQDLT